MIFNFRNFISATLFFLGLAQFTFGQLNITSAQQSGNWADYYVQEVLLGTGVEAFNVTFSGCDTTGGNEGLDSLQIGEFTSQNTLVDLPYGLMLHTGSVENFNGGANFSDGVSDIDLDSLLPGFTMNNAAILEFDFVPKGDTVRFNYVFGSLEYPAYVCSAFNDVFGFFLSGPGINGNFENNGENIALVPGTNIPVSINTINDVAGGSSCTQPCPCNTQYYINNNGFANDSNVRFSGLTVNLEAKHWVNCGDTYHIKLAIADAGDGVLNSGVFLEGGSFTSNLIEVNIASVNGDSTINEGCGSAEILFTRGDTTDTSITYIQFLGTATNGVDCDTIPDTIVLLPGVFDTTIIISPYFDNIPEGVEYLTIQAVSVTLCNDTFISEGTLYFHDIPDLNLTTTEDTTFDCPIDSLTILSIVQGGGPPPYTYVWNTGDTGSLITVPISSGPGVDTFAVQVWDSCALFSNFDTVFVTRNYEDDPVAQIINDTTVNCAGDSLNLVATVLDGNSPFQYLWSNGDSIESTVVVVAGTQTLIVTITDVCGRVTVDTVFVSVKSADDFVVLVPDSLIYCVGSTFQFQVKATGSAGPYEYGWSEVNPIFGDTNGKSILVNTDTTIWVWARDVCGRLTSNQFFIEAVNTDKLKVTLDDQNGECSGQDFVFDPEVSGGLEPYVYEWSSNDSDSVVVLAINVTQNVIVTVSDYCGNLDTANSLVTISKLEPMVLNVSGDNRLCFGEEYLISLLAFGGAGDYRYGWTFQNDPIVGESFVDVGEGDFRVVGFKNNVFYFKAIDKCGGTVQDTVSLEVEHCLEIPNVITPNSDGINDAFYIGNVVNFPDARLTVYNRWGTKVFDAQPYLNEWVPIEMGPGVYYYILTSEYFPELRGDLTIFKD